MHDSNDMNALFRILKGFADDVYPGNHGVSVTIRLPDGKKSRIQVPMCARPSALSPMELVIIEAMQQLKPREVWTAEQVAARAGYKHNGGFENRLAKLKKMGLIFNHNPGYSLTPPDPLES